MRHAPSKIEIALRYYYQPQPAEALEMKDAQDIRALQHDGMLERVAGHGFQLSARGQAWIQLLLHTPYPETRYVDPRNNRVIEGDTLEADPGVGWRPSIAPVAVTS